jgi:hypothetical protein
MANPFFSPFGGTQNPNGSTPGYGPSNASAAGTAASDLFAGFGDFAKAKGDEAEQQQYSDAAALARQNAQFTATSTAIQEAQAQREVYMNTGRTESEVAGAGFAMSGSGLDVLRSSAAQGSLQKAVLGQQGLITEAGYNEQATAYTSMASAAGEAAKSANTAAIGSFVAAGFSAVAAVTPS